jgi:hypothetical protein
MAIAKKLLFLAALALVFHFTIFSSSGGAACQPSGDSQFGTEGDHFIHKGNRTFLLCTSYYGGIHAPQSTIDSDLESLSQLGFNNIRVWAVWGIFSLPYPYDDYRTSVIRVDGSFNQNAMNKLIYIVQKAGEKSMTVDVTFSIWLLECAEETHDNPGSAQRTSCVNKYKNAIVETARQLKNYRNVFFDLGNERIIGDARHLYVDEIKQIADAVSAEDPQRMVTVSSTPNSYDGASGEQLYQNTGIDFASPHFGRDDNWANDTDDKIIAMRNSMVAPWNECPIYLQEPARNGYPENNPKYWTKNHFLTALSNAYNASAAGWCLHTDAGFELDKKSYFSQLDAVEADTIDELAGVINANVSNPVNGNSVPEVDLTWYCSGGFPPCTTENMGICSPQPYLKMNNNQYSLTFTAPKAANYTCAITATASYFDYQTTPQYNEKVDVYLNSKKVGTTTDSWCPPGGFIPGTPCTSTCLANGCETVIKNGEYTCVCGCTQCCSSCGDCGNNALKGGMQNWPSGQDTICFKIKNLASLQGAVDKAVVFGASSTGSREFIQIRYRTGDTLEPRAGFCFACACTDWCGMGQTGKDPDAVQDAVYKIKIDANGELTFSHVGGRSTSLWMSDEVKAIYPDGLNPNKYCIPGNGCSWNGHNYVFAPANTIEITSCGGNGGGTEKLCGQTCTPGVDTCKTGTCTNVDGVNKCYNCCGDDKCQAGIGENTGNCPEDCYCDEEDPDYNCNSECTCPQDMSCNKWSGRCEYEP